MALNLHQISAASGGNFAPSTILSFDKSQWLVPFRISAQVTALVPRYANMDALYHFLVLHPCRLLSSATVERNKSHGEKSSALPEKISPVISEFNVPFVPRCRN